MIEKLLGVMNKLPCDKAAHAAYGTALYAVLAATSPVAAIVAVVGIAVAREVYDSTKDNHTSDWVDAVATVALPVILFTTEVLK